MGDWLCDTSLEMPSVCWVWREVMADWSRRHTRPFDDGWSSRGSRALGWCPGSREDLAQLLVPNQPPAGNGWNMPRASIAETSVEIIAPGQIPYGSPLWCLQEMVPRKCLIEPLGSPLSTLGNLPRGSIHHETPLAFPKIGPLNLPPVE